MKLNLYSLKTDIFEGWFWKKEVVALWPARFKFLNKT